MSTLTGYARDSGEDLAAVRRAIGDTQYGSGTVRGLLNDICGNTNTASPSGTCY